MRSLTKPNKASYEPIAQQQQFPSIVGRSRALENANPKLVNHRSSSKKYGKREILGNTTADSWIFKSSKIPTEVKVK